MRNDKRPALAVVTGRGEAAEAALENGAARWLLLVQSEQTSLGREKAESGAAAMGGHDNTKDSRYRGDEKGSVSADENAEELPEPCERLDGV